MRVLCASILGTLLLTAACQQSVHITIDAQRDTHPISPYIYGLNQPLDSYSTPPLLRTGGNRWTAYNWTNNASNAGNDWHFQSDNFLAASDAPGAAVAPRLRSAAAVLLTIPSAGYVAADKRGDGDVRTTPDFLQQRFHISLPRKPPEAGPFTLTPNPADPIVYQDEFINWLRVRFPDRVNSTDRPLWFALDNEPDLWSTTHSEIHPSPTTYDEISARDIDYAGAIKAILPHTLIFGPVNYGWQGMVRLQNAPDANDRDFLDFYLDQMRQAEAAAHQRLLDVLDVHWYPEALGGAAGKNGQGTRIIEQDASPQVAEARIQAPRSLWDPTYTERSWITEKSLHAPITLLPRLQKKIADHYPGTRLALTEYNYGGGSDISGALAQADALGIFGQHAIFAACEWPLVPHEPFIAAAFNMYRNFDGQGARFGDTALATAADQPALASAYASRDSAGHIILIAINKTTQPLATDIRLLHAPPIAHADLFCLTAAAPQPLPVASSAQSPLTLSAPAHLRYLMPPLSITTIRLTGP